MNFHMRLLMTTIDIHTARIGVWQDEADIDLSVREALRLIRRVDEVAALTPKQRDYFEGYIAPEGS